MKTNLILKNIEIAGVKIGEVNITQEYTATEAINGLFAVKKVMTELVKELPDLIDNLKLGIEKTEETFEEKSYNNYLTLIQKATSSEEIESVINCARGDGYISDKAFKELAQEGIIKNEMLRSKEIAKFKYNF